MNSTASPSLDVRLEPETRPLAERIVRQIKTPLEDVVSIAVHAGIEAIAEALERDGKIGLPAKLAMAPRGRRAVFIREVDYLQIVRAGELVGLRDPANDFVAWVIQGAADDPDDLVDLAKNLAKNQRDEEGGES